MNIKNANFLGFFTLEILQDPRFQRFGHPHRTSVFSIYFRKTTRVHTDTETQTHTHTLTHSNTHTHTNTHEYTQTPTSWQNIHIHGSTNTQVCGHQHSYFAFISRAFRVHLWLTRACMLTDRRHAAERLKEASKEELVSAVSQVFVFHIFRVFSMFGNQFVLVLYVTFRIIYFIQVSGYPPFPFRKHQRKRKWLKPHPVITSIYT